MKRTLAALLICMGLAAEAVALTAVVPASPQALELTPAQVALSTVPLTAATGVAAGFLPPREKIPKPYTNDKCLKNCHELPGFGAGARNGVLRNIQVDPKRHLLSIHAQKGIECLDCHVDADPNFHPRVGYAKVDCRACHAEKPPKGVYPPDALRRLQTKGIKPPPKESLKGDGWMKTLHAKAWVAGNPAAPACRDCHTAHYQKKAKDPGSTVSRANLANLCGSCHADQVRSYDVGGLLARFRISGHGKGDLSNRYDVTECLSCHPGEGAHGEETITKQACPRCHLVPPKAEREGRTLVLSSLHARPLASDQPVARVLRWLYNLGFWGAAAGAGVLVLFLGFSTLYRSKDP